MNLLRHLAAVGFASSVMLASGCHPLRPAGTYPPPPMSALGAMPPEGMMVAARPAGIGSAPAPAEMGVGRAGAGSAATVVRGQDSGFSMPPDATAPADGGRHSRDPVPVSGQRGTRIAQAPPAAGELPAPSPYRSTPYPAVPTAPPSLAPPAPYGGAPAYAPAPGIAAPPLVGTPSFGPMPEIIGDDLGLSGSLMNPAPYVPVTRTADIIVNGYPARTGRIQFGGAVNSDAGVTGQVTVEERNFDITRVPTSFQDLFSGTAFRGDGQTFRLELVPGSRYKRYSVSFSEPFLFDSQVSLSTSAFIFDRRYDDWDEERAGGRLGLGYRITPDLSLSTALRAENVEITNPQVIGVPQLDEVLGNNEFFSGQLQLTHDTRNSPFAPSEGHYMQMSYEQAFGDFVFPRGEFSLSKYFLIRERADGSGRQTLTAAWNVGVSGEDTPLFENYFAGGYTTIRGFSFRGASPTVSGVQVGGRFQFLGTFEYLFPLTADDMLRGVAFIDYGTVEQDIEINRENFRVTPGVGLRIAIPALGPAPLAFDFGFPIADAAGDEQQTFSLYMGTSRKF